MLDIELIYNSKHFAKAPDSPTRVALFNQSSRAIPVLPGASAQRFETHFPGLGLLSLARSLENGIEAGDLKNLEIRFFDEEACSSQANLVEELSCWLGPATRRVILASTYTQTLNRLQSFLANFDPRQYLIILGGAHATTAPDIEFAHIVVRGEGAAALRHTLKNICTEDFGQGQGAQGLCYIDNGQRVIGRAAYDRSLEQAESPAFAYHLLPSNVRYATNFQRFLGQRPQIYVCTQSCRARCTFCSTYVIHGRQVTRPVDLIGKDLDYLIRVCGHDAIEFHDDDLLQHDNFGELLTTIARFNVPWFCYTRAELLTSSVAQEMHVAGCRRVFVGIESMQQSKLDYFNKRTTVDVNKAAAQACAEAGIGVIAGFILGAPDDTTESILDDLDAFLELPLYALNPSVLSPDPGTVEAIRARQLIDRHAPDPGNRKRLMPDSERWGSENPAGLPTVCRNVSKAELNHLRRLVLCSFYLRPEVCARLAEGRTGEQKAIVAEFIHYLRVYAWQPLLAGTGNCKIDDRVADMAVSFETLDRIFSV